MASIRQSKVHNAKSDAVDQNRWRIMPRVGIRFVGQWLTRSRPGKIFRIGFLDGSTPLLARSLGGVRQELTNLGWVEGKNIIVEYRFGENKGSDRQLELAADLVRLKVDLIVAASTGDVSG